MEIRNQQTLPVGLFLVWGEGGAVQGKRSSLTPEQEEVKVKAAMSKS